MKHIDEAMTITEEHVNLIQGRKRVHASFKAVAEAEADPACGFRALSDAETYVRLKLYDIIFGPVKADLHSILMDEALWAPLLAHWYNGKAARQLRERLIYLERKLGGK